MTPKAYPAPGIGLRPDKLAAWRLRAGHAWPWLTQLLLFLLSAWDCQVVALILPAVGNGDVMQGCQDVMRGWFIASPVAAKESSSAHGAAAPFPLPCVHPEHEAAAAWSLGWGMLQPALCSPPSTACFLGAMERVPDSDAPQLEEDAQHVELSAVCHHIFAQMFFCH